MIVFNPIARPKETVRKIEKITSLEGKVVGLLNNCWPSWEALINKMETILKEKYRVKEVKIFSIPLASDASGEMIEETARLCDICVVGLSN